MSNKSPLDVGADELVIVKAVLARHVPDATVWVFGSRAKGTAKNFPISICALRQITLWGLMLRVPLRRIFLSLICPGKWISLIGGVSAMDLERS